MRLYYAPGACSLSPHIVAREAVLPVEISKVAFSADGRTTDQGEDFYQVNPKGGYVPALRLDDGSVLTEGIAIVQYMADRAPSLAPEKGSDAHYRLLEWLAFITTELHKGFGVFFRPDAPEEERSLARARLEKRLSYVEGALTGDYLLGGFTIVDAYLYTILRWCPKAGIALAAYPSLMAFMGRMEEREGVRVALKEEGLAPYAD